MHPMSYRSHSSSHGFSDSSRTALRERWRASRLARKGHCLVWCVIALIGAMVTASPLRAGPEAQPQTPVKKAPAKTPRPKYDRTPYLLVFEPPGVRTRSLQGPRLRQPPLLPSRKDAHEIASATPDRREAPPPVNEHKSDSVLSSDPMAPAISIPKTSSNSTTAEPSPVEQIDNALAPPKGQEPELKDAAIYFEAPIGSHGARATIPIPAASSPAQTPPASSATYQQK